MSPKTPEQFQEVRERSRELLIDAALETFARYGFHGASVSRIAAHAGVSKGLLYNYFSSKEDLLDAVIVRGIKRMEAMFDELPATDDIFGLLEYIIKASYASMKRERTFWQLYMIVLTNTRTLPRVHRLLQDSFSISSNAYTALLDSAGLPDARTEALKLGMLLDGMALQYLFINGDFQVEPIIESIVRSYRQMARPQSGTPMPSFSVREIIGEVLRSYAQTGDGTASPSEPHQKDTL